jgi:hypothetical protein
VDIVVALIAFFALVASWFVLPSSPPVAGAETKAAVPETLAQAA